MKAEFSFCADLKGVVMNVESAFAMDGGSLGLSLIDETRVEHFTMNRSVTAVGTPRYEEIVDEAGVPLALAERRALLGRLAFLRDTLAADDLNLYVVDEYLKVLRRS